MELKLENKVILVTGGGSGIGAVIAENFAKEKANVVIIGRRENQLKKVAEKDKNISYIVADVVKTEDIEKVISEIKNHYGKLDVLVNNAGIAPVTPLENQTMEEFDQVFNVNVKGVVNLTKLALPLLKESKGNVINISSAVANNPFPNMSVYSSSKAALNTLTIVWAKELAKYGIRVNSVAVGPIETPIYEKTDLSEEEVREHKETVNNIVPLGRFGTSEEVANVVLFLASEVASYVTGSDYAVDGGFGA